MFYLTEFPHSEKQHRLLNSIFTIYCLNRIQYYLSLVSTLLKCVDLSIVVGFCNLVGCLNTMTDPCYAECEKGGIVHILILILWKDSFYWPHLGLPYSYLENIKIYFVTLKFQSVLNIHHHKLIYCFWSWCLIFASNASHGVKNKSD